ncbi:MAG: hypothetical protein IJ087_00505 [Eggerthellaceae bacterium]|nr:hypothetical protein [Eggerthellaceae bacterium]
MAETRIPSERYAAMAEDLIEHEGWLAPIAHSEVRIAYLSSDAKKTSKGKAVYGQCEKVSDKYKWAVPYDFAIVIYEPNVAGFNESRLRILMLHELMHVGVFANEDGEEVYKIVSHDVEDFRAILDRFGMDWAVPEGGDAA